MMDRKTIIEIFKASPTPTSIVQADDTDFTFILVNDAYLQMTQREEDELLGKSLFKAFPANPEEEKPTGVDKLRSSFQKVIDSKKTDEISSIRYDIILDDGEYKQVYWKVINTPVLNEKGAVEIIINSATNITSQVLSKRENKLMLNNTEDSFILINRQLIIQNFNNLFAENYKEIFGLEVNKGDSILEYTQPERREKAKDIYKQVFKGKTIENEISAKSEDGHSRFFNIKFKPAKDENGEIIGSFISLIEKTDEHIAKLELEQNEARYRALVENGNDILFILTPEGKPKYASLSINNVLGYTPDEALELSIISSVHPDDIEMMAEEIQKCLDKPGVPIEVPPARLKDKEGNWHWFEGTITNMLHDPAIEGIVDNFREITDRLKAEKQIVEAKEQYQSLVQTINGVIWESDPKTLRVKYISPQSKGILGYEPEEWINTPGFWEKHLHPDDRQQTVKIFNEQTKSGNHHELEYRFKKSSGEYAWIRDVISFVKQKDKPAIVRGLMMDMSHEHELKQKLEQTYKIAQIGTWDLDLEDESLYWSNFVKDLHEVPKNFEPDLDSALEFYKKGWSRKAIIEAVENTIEHGTSFDLELNIITAKGNEKWVRAIGHPVMHNGVCKRIYGSTQNITTRKKAELQLKESNFSLIERVKEQRCLYEISNLKEQELSIDELLSKTVDLIPSGFQFNEITEAKIIWKDQSFKTDDFGESKITLTQSDDRFGEKNLLIEVHYVDTEHSYEELSFLEEENKLLKAITNQLSQKIDQIIKRDELKAAEEKFRNVVEHSTNMFYQHDTQGVLTYISPQSSEFLGFSGDEAMTDWTEYITGHPINELGKQLTERAIKTGEVQPPYELQMRKKDGDIIWVEVNEAPLKQNGKVIGIVGSLTDITDRKIYEEQLHESLERYDYVTKATRDAIYDWDIKTDNLHWGEGFKNLFGYEINVELYPIDKWAELVHPADIKETREDLNSILQDSSKDTWSIEYRFLRKDGSYAHVLENGFIIRDENGKATRMIGALRDISDIKQIEIQNQLKQDVAQIFKADKKLDPMLNEVISHLAHFGNFSIAEIWLKSQEDTHLNLISTYASDKKGQKFYEESKYKNIFSFDEGLPGIVWRKKSIESWDSKMIKKSFLRKEAAFNADIKSVFGLPLLHNDEVVAILVFGSDDIIDENKHSLYIYHELQTFLGGEIKRKQQQEEMILLFESAPEIIAIATPNGYFSKVNPAFCELLGYTEEEITSQPFDKFIYPEDLKETLDEFNDTIIGERNTKNYINRYVTKDGDLVWISWYSSDVFSKDGYMFAFGRDVTDIKELESLLKQTNRLAKVGSWELIIRDNKDDSMYWSDITREILEVGDNYNPTLTGGFEFYTEESMAIIQQAVENAIHKGLPFDEELKLISAKGNTRYVRCIGDAVFVDGKCERIYGSFQDITDKKTAEIELQKAFKEKNTILESIGDAFFAVDHNWTITYWNREAEALLDKPREDIIGKNLWEEYEDAVELEFYSQYHKAVEEQVRVDFEEYYPGAEKWFDVSAYPSETGLSVFFHDITEKKQANQKIQETNEKLKTAQQIAKLGYWELNLETKETFWSEQSYKIWEFDPNISITQELIFERMHPDDVDFFMEQHQNMLETNSPLELEHRIILPNGNIKWIRVKGDLYKSDTGEPKYVEGTAQDITGQKEAELELDEALKQKENILESIGDAFYAVDKNWTVTYWNREAERLMQTPRSEIVDNNVWDVFPEATEMKTYTYLHRAMHENKTIDFEDFYPPLEKWLNISAYPSPDGVSVFFKDITESKKAREELEKLNTKLQQRAQELAASNAELEQFAYVASHDLQEPLRMVTSFLTQLEKKYGDKLDDKATEYINFAVDGAQRMRQIILDLLNYSRLNQDKNTLEKVDLNKVLKEVQSLERSHIEESGAEIIIPELPVIMANPGPIKQVFKNLLNNALKYHNSGTTPKVELLVEEQESHWKFSVKDNGIGINPEFQENIFQIFQRLHTRDQYSGTGIGLAISKKIIERHGGEIWVESEEGKGSTFVFTIEK